LFKTFKSKKNCHSWNNDVLVYDSSGKGDVISSTDYSVGVFKADVMQVFLGDHVDHQLTLTYGVYDKLTAIFTFGGDINMLLFDPKQTTGELITQYGKLIATVDGTTILDKILVISDVNGSWIYNISDNAYNLKVNPCRSHNVLASSFFTIEASDNSENVISKELFVATISSLILYLASDSNKEDSCTGWTIYGRWLFTALMCLVGLCAFGCFIRALKKGYIVRSLKQKFTFLDKDPYPVIPKRDSTRRESEVEFVKETDTEN